MTFSIYLISFLVLISIVVFFHELGHFSFARFFGVRVLDFSIGFGKSIKSWETKSKTIFNLRILPLGGYVKMNDEEDFDESKNSDSYSAKHYHQKLLITLGGPIFNFILAFLIFFVINIVGTYKTIPIVGDIIPNSPAFFEGIKKGDLISRIDDSEISYFSEAQLALSKRLGESGNIEIYVLRNGNSLKFELPIQDWLSAKEPSNLLYEIGILPPIEPIVGSVFKSSPAEQAGIMSGDKILEINNKKIIYWSDIKQEIYKSNGEEISFSVLRENKIEKFTIKPSLSENDYEWKIGVNSSFMLSSQARISASYSVIDSFKNSFFQTYSVIENSIIFLLKILNGQVSAKNLGGPVMIGQYAGESVIYGGLYSFIYLVAFISISLGIVNLLPLPILDGGQALILTLEKLIGQNIPTNLLELFSRVSVAILLFIFIFVFFNDIFRILG